MSTPARIGIISGVAKIELHFSNLPSDVALAISDQANTRALAEVARSMRLGVPEGERLRQELVGVIAQAVDPYLP